jgi:polar amino acid transport system substrate-binding protein
MNNHVQSVPPLRQIWRFLIGILLVLMAYSAVAQQESKILRSGWYQWDPYQYEIVKKELKHLTGLDVQLLRTVFGKMGIELQIDPVSWRQHLQDVKDGTRDIAGGAYRNKEREAYAYYSIPYRSEKNMLYVREGEQQRFVFKTAEELVKILESGEYKLGVIESYFYGESLMQYINNPQYADKIIKVKDNRINFTNLLEHKIDAFPIDHLAGVTLGWRYGWQKPTAEMPNPIFEEPVHVLFSKETTSPELVARFNHTLLQMQNSGEYNKLLRDYLLPVLLEQTAGQDWFFMIGILGTIAFSISGLLLAREGKYSLFGALVLAALPSIGGGIMRDILIMRETLSAVKSPVYLATSLATVMFFYVVFHLEDWYRRTKKRTHGHEHMFIGRNTNRAAIEFFDALGMSTFAVVGVIVAVEAKIEPLWMWGPLLAALTGAGGGILRDVIRADADNPGLKGSFYAEVALIWGLILSLFLNWYSFLPKYEPSHLTFAVVGVIFGGLATRIAVVYYKIRSPMY